MADVSGVAELLANISLDQPIELNSAEDGNNIGEEVDDCIQSPEDANLSDDENDEDDEDYDDDEDEDAEDDEDEDAEDDDDEDDEYEDYGDDEDEDAEDDEDEDYEGGIPVTAAEFLANPTAEKLQALGNRRAEKLLHELGNEERKQSAIHVEAQTNANKAGVEIRDLTNEEFEELAAMKMFVKISSVMDSENNDVKNAVYQCTDAIMKKLCSSEKYTPQSMDGALIYMQRFKGSASGMLLTLEHAVKQQFFNEGTAQMRNEIMALLSRINSSTPTQSYLKLYTVNVGSVRSKSASVYDFVCESKADLYAMTETWLTDDDSAIIHDIAPAGYRFVHHPRAGRLGGGTALLFKDTINVHQVIAGETTSFEFACYHISFGSIKLLLSNIYRPPYSEKHPVGTSVFYSQFQIFLQEHLLRNIPVIITGDFNIHVNDINNPDKKSFMTLLDRHSCTQHVDFLTHKGRYNKNGVFIPGHTLDLVITRKSDNIIVGRPRRGPLVSDHFSVVCKLNSVEAPVPSMKTSFRKIGCINKKSLKSDVANSSLCLNTPDDLTKLFTLYTDTLSSILNKHAPLITKTVTSNPEVPWLTDDVRKEKRKRREAENKWLGTKSRQDYKDFKDARDKALSVMNEARKNYYSDMIKENSSDQRSLVNVTKPLLNMTSLNQVIPAHVDKIKFVNLLGQFFCDKIVRIHSDINSAADDGTCTPDIFSDPTVFQISHFKTLYVKDVEKLVGNLSKKSCFLDPMPIKLLLPCIELLLPVITKIINLSLSRAEGVFPSDWKVALVTPLLIKHGMEMSFDNLRPVSNLPFISRLVEGAVTQQIEEHIRHNALIPCIQSASRQCHSTETALVRIQNDLLLAMDNKKVTLVVLLNLSAAFDTIDHGILLKILKSSCGLSDRVLSWIKSYLFNRQQKLILDDVISDNFHVPCGVPQGSRLGPLLFTLFISNLIKIIQKFPNVSCHRYADDTQLYISFSPDKEHQDDNISILKSCIRYICSVMFQHKLMPNDEKTAFLIVGTSRQDAELDINWITVGESEVKLRLNMEKYISDTCESAFYALHNLRHIRSYLDQKSTESLVHEYITSRLDYCNGLLFGLPDSQIKKLQDVQDDCARLVRNIASKSYNMKPVFKKLSWLPIKQRIEFKILLLVYKALNGHAPEYLSELLSLKSIPHEYNLRSTQEKLLLHLPQTKTKVTLGDRAFSCAAPKLWNKLPPNIRAATSVDVFKALLKTHLFSGAFE